MRATSNIWLASVLSLAILVPPPASAKKGAVEGAPGSGWTEFRDTNPLPTPSAEQKARGVLVFSRSTLERVYPQSRPRPSEAVTPVSLQAARGEYEPVQLAVYPLRKLKKMTVRVADLTDDAHHSIPAANVDVRMVRFYGSPLSITARKRFAVLPKTLEVAVPIDLEKDRVRPYWITVHVPEDQPGGTYRGTITLAHAAGSETLPFSVEVLPVRLREPDISYGTLIVNLSGSGAKARGASKGERLDSAERWKGQVEAIYRDQREHGMNTVSPRSGKTYREVDGNPRLPELETAIEMYGKYGFRKPLIYVPSGLLKTNKVNRSESYRKYDPAVHVPQAKRIAAYYTRRFQDAGLPGIVFVPVEEPNFTSGVGWPDPPDARVKIARELSAAMKEVGASVGLIGSPESLRPTIEYLDLWIMAYRKFTPDLYELARQRGAKLAIYANATVMGNGTYFSRFLFGYFAWANRLDGVLPWTYPLHPKRFPVNVQGRGEGGLDVRDGFLGPDGRPIPTLQWELCREGIEDAKVLTTVETMAREARATGQAVAVAAADDAEKFLAGIRAAVQKDPRHYVFEDPATFAPAPQDGWDAAKFDSLRRQAFDLLRRLSAFVPA